MCQDPWTNSLERFAMLYLEAVRESKSERRTDRYRHIWTGKAVFFEEGYHDKLNAADAKDIENLIATVRDDEWDELELLLKPAEAELKRRADQGKLI